MSLVQAVDWWVIAVPVTIAAGALLVLLVDALVPPLARYSRWLALATVVTAGVFGAAQAGTTQATFCVQIDGLPSCSYALDSITTALSVIVLAGAAIVILMPARGGTGTRLRGLGEYYFLLLASVTGAVTLAGARDLVTVVIALEVLSLPAFAMIALPDEAVVDGGSEEVLDRRGPPEAALKAFLLSVVALAVMVVGVALIYGATGTIYLDRIAAAAVDGTAVEPVGLVGSVLVLAGLLFKVAAVPFHGWVPDTYVGASERVAAYFSVVSKAGGFAGLLVVTWFALRPYGSTWGPILAAVSAITMTVGNLGALRQQHAVRMLAWSSIAQSGFILAPLAAAGVATRGHGVALDGASATVAYLAVYVVMNAGAFAVVSALVHSSAGRFGRLLEDYRGLARTEPAAAFSLAFFLLCLSGLPPGIVGLVVKVVVVRSAVDASMGWLAVVMAVNVVIGLTYYLRWAALLFARPGQGHAPVSVRLPATATISVGLALGATVALSVWPQAVLQVL